MDLVYPLKRISINDNFEFRYSLRSAERFLNFDNVWIIGYKPHWINDLVKYKPMGDFSTKHQNVFAKMLWIISEESPISEDFILMNDDFYFFKRYNVIPYYHKGSLREWCENYPYKNPSNVYYALIKNTFKLFPNGLTFEVHFPIVYNKTKLRNLIEKYKIRQLLKRDENKILLRSAYCNEYINEISPVEFTEDYKATTTHDLEKYKDCPFLSTSDVVGWSSQFKTFISARFPNPSRFEK